MQNRVIRSKVFLMPLLAVWVLMNLVACEQSAQSKPPLTVGIVSYNAGHKPIIEAFKHDFQKLKDDIRQPIIWLEPVGTKPNQIDEVLDDMAAKGVDLVFSTGSFVTRKTIARFKGSDTKVVFAPSFDPVRLKVVDQSLHGNHVTGVKVGGSSSKALGYLLMVDPSIKKILVPHSHLSKVENFSLPDFKAAAKKLSVELVMLPVDKEAGLKAALQAFNGEVDAIWLLHSKYLVPQVDTYVEYAIENGLLLGSATGQGKSGVMVSYGKDAAKVGSQAARLAYYISQGVLPRDLPIETADFYLSINLKNAKEAGLEIPLSLLHLADHVYVE